MPQKNPSVSYHAIQRAYERFNLQETTFREWAKTTHQDWIPVNAEFLINNNLKVNAKDSWFYVTPWTAYKGMALCLSDDNCIRTVMDFETKSKIEENYSSKPKLETKIKIEKSPSKALNFEKIDINAKSILSKAFVKIISDDSLKTEDIYRKLLHLGRNVQPEDIVFIESYVKNEIDLSGLREIFCGKTQYREMAWARLKFLNHSQKDSSSIA